MEAIDFNTNTIIMTALILLFSVAMALIKLIFYVFKKIFECRDETDFGVQNRLIGKIWFKKKPKEKGRASKQN